MPHEERCAVDGKVELAAHNERRLVGFHFDSAPRDLRAVALAASRRLIGKHFGIIRSCVKIDCEAFPALSIYLGKGPLRIPGWNLRVCPNGAGVSMDSELAFLAAVAEAAERYSAMAPVPSRSCRRASFLELGGVAVHPSSFALFSANQYRRRQRLLPFTEDTLVDWLWAFSLTRRKPCLVPAALLSLDGRDLLPKGLLAERVSTGFACHVSLLSAALAGLCETLERDAVTIAWHSHLPLIPLDPSGTPVAELLAGPLASGAANFALYQVPTDLPFPVVVALASASDDVPHLVMGAACRPDGVKAAEKALYEASQLFCRYRVARPVRPHRIRDHEDHGALYATKKGAEVLRRHLRISEDSRSLRGLGRERESEAADLAFSVSRLESLGLEALISEVTTADIAASGFRVVRVLVPGTVDISADARYPRLGGTRMYHLPAKLGLADRPLSEAQLNLLPIPLA